MFIFQANTWQNGTQLYSDTLDVFVRLRHLSCLTGIGVVDYRRQIIASNTPDILC